MPTVVKRETNAMPSNCIAAFLPRATLLATEWEPMMEYVNLWIVVATAVIGGLTPGPGTLAIAGASMNSGRTMGLSLAWGITTGSLIWAVSAALGFGALLTANQWAFEIIRYCGVIYFSWLAYRAARTALQPGDLSVDQSGVGSHTAAWIKGALIHLTNPKAVIFWGSILAIGLKPGATSASIAWVVCICITINFIIVTSYAMMFSVSSLMQGYLRLRRWIESIFAAFFASAAYVLFSNRP